MEVSTFQANTMYLQYDFLNCQDSLLKLILHKIVYKSSKYFKVYFEQHLVSHVIEILGGVVALEHGKHVLS